MGDVGLLDELLDPFTECLNRESAQRVANFPVSPSIQKRVDSLAEKANEGTLTEDERADYEALTNTADVIAILRLKARRILTPPMPS